MSLIATVDFETEAIMGNPLVNPPRPVGVAVWLPDSDPWYRPTDDPATVEYLRWLWSTHHLLFHNAPFDLSVAQTHLGLPWPAWDRVHDTMYLVFLLNPYGDLSLKGSSEEILGIPPEEQDELHDWIVNNVPGATRKKAGAFISKAPFHLVEKYAIGDVVRTRQLFDHCMRVITDE